MSRRATSSRPFASLMCAFVLIALVPATSLAQEVAEGPMRTGAWAVLFSIGDNFTLSSFNGAAIAVKRHTSASGAWRAGVSLDLSDLGYDLTVEQSDTTAFENELEMDRQSVGIDLDRLQYFGKRMDLRPYYGFGPRVSWADEDLANDGLDRAYRSWSIGANVLLGVEYRASSSLGIHAEYQYGLQYIESEEVRPGSTPGSSETLQRTSWTLGSRAVRFGLSAYF